MFVTGTDMTLTPMMDMPFVFVLFLLLELYMFLLPVMLPSLRLLARSSRQPQ
jgi:hypothetical protein